MCRRLSEPEAVELRAARIPLIGALAHHHWLVVVSGAGTRDRWEVWQRRNAGGESWGHLHRNLMPHDAGVGNGPSWVVRTWEGDDATQLMERLVSSPQHYPWCQRYLPWPGPNSNTFVSWILGDSRQLGWRAVGRGYPVLCRARGSTRQPPG